MYGGTASPSPSFPQTIHNVSGSNNIKVQNKNLFDKTNVEIGKELISTTGQTDSNANWYTSEYIEILPSTNYYLSGQKTKGGANCFYDKDKNFISTVTAVIGLITSPSNAYYIRFNGYLTELDNNIQLEQSSTETTYIAHQEQNLPLTLGNTELRKIDTAKDFPFKAVNGDKYYDSLTTEEKNTLNYGSWYIHKETGKVVFDENSTFTKWNAASSATRNAYRIAIAGIVPYTDSTKVIKVLTTKFKATKQTGVTWVAGDISGGTVYPTNVVFMVGTDVTASGMNALVLGEPLYYVLETPTNTEITDATLISQLEALLQAKSYNQQTNISQTNDDLPFILDIAALKNI